MRRLQSVRERLRLSLWFVPAVLGLASGLLALVLGWVDRTVAPEAGSLTIGFGGSPEGARSVLSTIAQSMLTFTGLVFTITMLVLQLASTQLSPRVMRTFLRDRGNQVVLGLFVATFVYTLLVLREVRTPVDSGAAFVPAISVWVAFALLLASVAAFVWYIDHMAHAIRASTVIANIWKEAVQAVERLYPDPVGRDPGEAWEAWPAQLPPPEAVLMSPGAGVVTGVDETRLLQVIGEADRKAELIPQIGDFIADCAPLARLWGSWTREDRESVRASVMIEGERTLEQDLAFGFRQLVDVAVRALSPGTNDPTTAVQALDRIYDLLGRLAVLDIPSAVRLVKGQPRLLLPRPSWDDYVRLALEEIRLAGASQVQVTRRLLVVLVDLEARAPEERVPSLRAARRELERIVSRDAAQVDAAASAHG